MTPYFLPSISGPTKFDFPFSAVNSAWALSKHVRQAKDMDEIFKTCDYITVHVPSTKDTKGMLNSPKKEVP